MAERLTAALARLLDRADRKHPSASGGSAAERRRMGEAAGLVGILCNLLLAAVKGVTAMAIGAVSIGADAVNNLSDAVSSAVTMAGFRLAGRLPDREHPYGHGRVEYIAGFIVSAAVAVAGIELFRTSLQAFRGEAVPEVGWPTLAVTAAAIAVKALLARYDRRLAVRLRSTALQAAAADSRADCAATAVTLLAVAAQRWAGVRLDGVAGMLVSAYIVYTAFGSARDTATVLIGGGADRETAEAIRREALAVPEILDVHDLRIHEYGPGCTLASMHAEMPHTLSLSEAHAVVDRLERRLTGEGLVNEMVIHVDPSGGEDSPTAALREAVRAAVREVEPRSTVHDFECPAGEQLVRLDIALPYESPATDGDMRAAAERAARRERPGIAVETHIDRI